MSHDAEISGNKNRSIRYLLKYKYNAGLFYAIRYFRRQKRMPNSSRFLAFIVPFLLLSSFVLLFLFKDFFFAFENRPGDPNHNENLNNEVVDLISFENDADIFLPIIIDGINITARVANFGKNN